MFVILAGLSFIMIGSIIISYIHEPPIDPPMATAKRCFGEIVWVKIIRQWFIVIPNIESVEYFPVQKFLLRVNPREILAQDNVSLEVSFTLHLEPDPDNLLTYLQSGKEEGIKKILAEVSEQEIRQWAKGSPDSPNTWEDAQGCQGDLVEKLHRRLVLKRLWRIFGESNNRFNNP